TPAHPGRLRPDTLARQPFPERFPQDANSKSECSHQEQNTKKFCQLFVFTRLFLDLSRIAPYIRVKVASQHNASQPPQKQLARQENSHDENRLQRLRVL
ncbi:hypothetical protein, partial [Paracoccus sp. (in: a-proteobacteria)]|uniref:hypothetical protein n=1 Tax=Paracoccus sp. TaxID=267 RepID=UPI0028A9D59B